MASWGDPPSPVLTARTAGRPRQGKAQSPHRSPSRCPSPSGPRPTQPRSQPRNVTLGGQLPIPHCGAAHQHSMHMSPHAAPDPSGPRWCPLHGPWSGAGLSQGPWPGGVAHASLTSVHLSHPLAVSTPMATGQVPLHP